MLPNLECKLRLKTNTYLPEIPSSWLNSSYLPKFKSNLNQFSYEELNFNFETNEFNELKNGPFISACYSDDGEIIAISNFDSIFLLGSFTKTCFAAISFNYIKEILKIKEESLVCNELYILGCNQFLITLFDDFICLWDISFYYENDLYCYSPKYIGSLKIYELFQFINQKSNEFNSKYYSESFKIENTLKNKFVSIQGIKIKKDEKFQNKNTKNYQNLIIEFNIQFSEALPLLIQISINNNHINSYSLKINKIYDIIPTQILDLLFLNNNDLDNIYKRIISFLTFNNSNSTVLYSNLQKIYFLFIHINEKNYIYLFDDNKDILCIEMISNYNKRQYKYLNSCKILLNNRGDLLIIQYSDKFSVYSISKNNIHENNYELDNENELCYNLNNQMKLKLKLLYTYTQVIQKEWISSISIFKDKNCSCDENPLNEYYSPITQMYPCGVVAVTTISSSGLSFYYLMKICSLSDTNSYKINRKDLICDHKCEDKTGSNLIIWKLELTRLNGIRKILWQPGESTCLAIQFPDKIKNSKLLYDDFLEIININRLNISDLDRNIYFGNVFFIEPSSNNDDMLLWSRLMVDFTAIHKNKEYIESEDEFDIQSQINNSNNLENFNLSKYYQKKRYDNDHLNLFSFNHISINDINFNSPDIENYNNYLDKNVCWISNDKETKKKYLLAINYNIL